jgi:RimJ/RimL family protein N-acetyltransferase
METRSAARLETTRLVLRDFQPDDWEAIHALVSDPNVRQFMHFRTWSEDKTRAWFTWCIANNQQTPRDAYNWAITLRATGDVAGWLGIGGKSERSCGYALLPPYCGKGYMTEALRAVIEEEFHTLGARRIRATCEVSNIASARVLEKAGMARERTVYDADFEENWALRHHYVIEKEREG